MKTFKILGLLLSYPKSDLIDNLDEIEAVISEERLFAKRDFKNILKFTAYLRDNDIYALQEEYVALFDRGRAHCLHLFEHIHGESRDRGQAMVNLVESYAERGFYMKEGELPDYLPLFLEYLSHIPAEEAVDLIGDPVNVIATIAIRLKKRKSPYHIMFEALVALSKVSPDAAIVADANATQLRDQTLEELDEEWAEAEAFDNSAECNTCDFSTLQQQKTTASIETSQGVE